MDTEASQPDTSQPVPGQLTIQPEDGPHVIAVDVPEPRIVAVTDTPDDPPEDHEDDEDATDDDPETDHEAEGVPDGEGDDGAPGEDQPAEVQP